jgi:hypothetical protein
MPLSIRITHPMPDGSLVEIRGRWMTPRERVAVAGYIERMARATPAPPPPPGAELPPPAPRPAIEATSRPA